MALPWASALVAFRPQTCKRLKIFVCHKNNHFLDSVFDQGAPGPLNSNSIICLINISLRYLKKKILCPKNWRNGDALLLEVGKIDGCQSYYCIKFTKRLDEGQRLQLLGQKS